MKEHLRRVAESPIDDHEIIIVDTCSDDGTRDLLQDRLNYHADIVPFHDINKGKGAALRAGIAAASGDICHTCYCHQSGRA